jgi:hypothetical protein
MGVKRTVYRIVVGKPERTTPLGGPGHSCVGSINLDLREKGWGDMDWIDLAQDRDQWRALVNTIRKLLVP